MHTPALLLAVVVLSAQVLAAPPQPKGAATDPIATARAHFLSHEVGTPTVDAVVPLPAAGDPQGAGLKILLESAREIQLGCAAPCADADALVYRGKVEMIAANLGLDESGVAQALGRYLPKGKPRLRGADGAKGAQPMGDKMVEAQVLEKLLSDGSLGASREGLNRRALALADALGRGRLIDVPDAGGVAAAGGVYGGIMTAEQIRRLNALPRTQARILQNLASKAPPPPSSEGYRDFENKNGLIARSRAYWDAIAEDPKTGDLKRAGIATMVSLFEVFNLRGFENSCFRLANSASDPAASRKQVLKDSGSAVGNGLLAAMGFLPVSVWSKLSQVTGLSRAGEWITTGVRSLLGKPGTATAAANAERIAALQNKVAAGKALARDEAVWLAEATKGKAGVVFHTTDAVQDIMKSGRVAATTERFAYGATRHIEGAQALQGAVAGGAAAQRLANARLAISRIGRQLRAGVKPKDGLVVFQGDAAKLFQPHEVRGIYSGIKRVAGQQVTNGQGDIIITRAVFNPETNTLTITGARMVDAGERAFLFQSKAFAYSRMWGRRVFLDGGLTAATAFVAAPAQAREQLFEYALGPIPENR
ncbi:MAG: hypothetical protein WC969_14435 [Elusimicrobiota bacterium]|jgi:hypothetical protein